MRQIFITHLKAGTGDQQVLRHQKCLNIHKILISFYSLNIYRREAFTFLNLLKLSLLWILKSY